MKFGARKFISAVVLVAFSVTNSAYAMGTLAPADFNKMYYLATQGKVGILREAVNRGLNIDAVNPNGDTGLCIAVKRRNYVAYNSFRMSGANPRHACTYRIYKEYSQFLASERAVAAHKVVGNEESLYYNEKERKWWPWILGGALVGGGIWALTHKHKSHSSSSGSDDPIMPTDEGYGLTAYIKDYTKLVNSGGEKNSLNIDGRNSNSDKVVDKIKFLPNMLTNADYLKAYAKVTDGAYFNNLVGGKITLGDASVGLAAHGADSNITNDGAINVEARNGAIGMVASNGSNALNAPNTGISTDGSDNGDIRIIFKGSKEGDAVIGMYGDTHSSISNYGKIIGTTSKAQGTDDDSGWSVEDVLVNNEEDEEGNSSDAANSGTILGMSLFDYYTGKDLSSNTVSAYNYGKITLQAGNNNAESVSTSLIGMGSYLDDNFLNGKNNPAFAEQMILQNYGDIDLSYQKTYNLSSEALKLGNGGLIGIRADASTGAVNRGNIVIDMQATTIPSSNDVAAGILSLHGAGLVNGSAGSIYDGTGTPVGMIRVINEATSGGVFYGMLAAKGSGAQTGLYKWKTPYLHNYGLIDMQVSNSYAMASFAGGEIVNNGVINLGVENGQSYFTKNYGLFAEGKDITEEVSLINNGIINVYSEESAAINNVFSGSVTQTNTGYIYLSNKATNSKVFGGNYSTARNVGDVWYKVGNSASFVAPQGAQDKIGLNVQTTPIASIVTASGDGSTTKQYAVNEETGTILMGAARDKDVDYGGTFGTAAMQVSKQGSSDNKGVVTLDLYDHDIMQFNVGMWLDSTTTAEAYTDNYGDIVVNAPNSIGMRNDSASNASATNFGNIYANGNYSYGMATTKSGANIFNGRFLATEGETKTIYVYGKGAIGMYILNGNAWNYGTIKLMNDHTTAFQLDGKDAAVIYNNEITHGSGLVDATYFWMTNGASKVFEYDLPVTIDGYTLGKATTDSSGGYAYLSKGSTAYVSGSNSHLFVAKGSGSAVYNRGTVEVDDEATAVTAEDGAKAYNDTRSALMTVKHKDSIGIFGTDSQTEISNTAGALMVVEAGEGMHAEGFSYAENAGDINVEQGIGLRLLDGSGQSYTEGVNSGSVTVSSKNSRGVSVENGSHFTNTGGVSARGTESFDNPSEAPIGVYVEGGSVAKNDSTGGISVSSNAIGVYGNIVNSGEISVSGTSSYGVYGFVDNKSKFEVSGGTGVYGNMENYGTLEVSNGVGVEGSLTNESEMIVSGGKGVVGSLNNKSTVTITDGVLLEGTGVNSGTINTTANVAIIAKGSFRNAGTISGNGTAVRVDSGTFTNQETIELSSGTGIHVKGGATGINAGTINIGTGNGFYVESAGTGLNRGTISLEGYGYGAYVESGGSFTNTGMITYHSKANGHCANVGAGGTCEDLDKEDESQAGTTALSQAIVIEDGAQFINRGTVDMTNTTIDFGNEGKYVLADGGTYKAESFRGKVQVSEDAVMDGFNDTYVQENAFEGQNEGLSVSSKSYMFDADLNDKGNASDVILERKGFDKLVAEKDLANFFEENYKANNNEKMYKALKSAQTEQEFNAQSESEAGKKFYANLPRENMAVLRGLQHQEQKRVMEDGLQGASVGAQYFRTGKEGVDGLSDYSDNVYSAYIGGGKAINRNWSVGGTLEAAYVDSKYDDVNSERDNTILMAFLPIMYQNNRFKFLTTPSVGVGFGSYTRNTLSNKYEADTFDIYYGIYNAAEYSIDLKVAELVTEADINLQGILSDKAKEKGGLYLDDNDTTSLEGGIGLKLRKRIQLAKERELTLALGTKYYHEFLDPYKDLTIGAKGVQNTYRLKGYNEDKNRLRTSAEATYKDGPFALSAEIAHNAEKEENVEGGLGVRYNF